MNRRVYLDWLRGVGVLIMVEAHTLDSWTRLADHQRAVYRWAIIIGGFGAPVFLLLAGLALVLATGSRMRRGQTSREAAAMARRRGWQILGLAFLFRLQSWLISGGSPQTLLKVDILNIMGLAMVAAGLLWMVGRDRMQRTLLLGSAAAAATLLTPIVRQTTLLSPLPDPLEWYLRPAMGRTTFTLLPWAGFLFAGAAVGVWVDAARTDRQEARLNLVLLFVGIFVAIAGYAASFLPRVYAESNFWTSSPTFFFLRVGILLTLLPIAYGWNRFVTGRSPLREFGVASLFVYWIHVEMVYGVLSAPLHKQLSLEQAVVAFAAFSLFLFGLVKLKDAIPWRELSEPVTKSFDDFFRMSFKTPSSTSSSRSPRD